MLEILSHRASTCRKPPADFTLTIVRQNVQGRFLIFLRKQQFHEDFVVTVLRQRPTDACLFCRIQNLSDGVMGAV